MTKSFVVLMILFFATSLTKGQIDFEKPFNKCWSIKLNEFNSKIIASDNGNIYTFSDNKLVSISQNGIVNWSSDFDSKKLEPKQITIEADFLQILSEDTITKKIWSSVIGLNSGLLIKKDPFEKKEPVEINQLALNIEAIVKRKPKIITRFGNKLVTSDEVGAIYLVDINLRKVIWKQKVGAEIAQINVEGNDTYFSSKDNLIYKVNTQNGNRIWKRKVLGRNKYVLTTDRNYLIVSNLGEESVFLIKTKSGKVANQFEIESGDYLVGPPILLGGDIVVSSNEGLSLFSNVKCKKAE